MGQNIIGRCRLDDINAGDFPIVTAAVTLAAGRVYPVGSVVGKAATGKCALVDKAASDGTEEVYGVLLRAVDAVDADAEGVVALTGEYNRDRLVFADDNAWSDHIEAARKLSIFFKEPAP